MPPPLRKEPSNKDIDKNKDKSIEINENITPRNPKKKPNSSIENKYILSHFKKNLHIIECVWDPLNVEGSIRYLDTISQGSREIWSILRWVKYN